MSNYGARLNDAMKQFYTTVSTARQDLEKLTGSLSCIVVRVCQCVVGVGFSEVLLRFCCCEELCECVRLVCVG